MTKRYSFNLEISNWDTSIDTQETKLNQNYIIANDNFYKLLDYCFDNCQIVTFSDVSYGQKRTEQFMSLIEEFHVKTLQTKNWHCMNFEDQQDYIGRSFTVVYFYKTHERLKEIIKSYVNNLFFNTYDAYLQRDTIHLGMLEDICFFRDNKLLLGTVSHEFMCSVYPNSNSELDFFKNIVKDYGCLKENISSHMDYIDLDKFYKGDVDSK